MRWEDERYIRLYTRDTVTWKLLPWQGKVLLSLLLRKMDRAGILDVENGNDLTEAVAAVTDLPAEVVGPGLESLLRRGVLVHRPHHVLMPNFLAAQEAKASDSARQQKARELARDLARAEEITVNAVESVTPRDDPSRHVAKRHEMSRGVTPSLAVPSLPNQTVPVDPIAGKSPQWKAPKPVSKEKAEEAPGWKELVTSLFVKFKERRGSEPLPRPKDWKALKTLRARAKDDAEILLRWDRGLRAAFKARVDNFWDLNERWDALAQEPTTATEKPKDVRKGYAYSDDQDWSGDGGYGELNRQAQEARKSRGLP